MKHSVKSTIILGLTIGVLIFAGLAGAEQLSGTIKVQFIGSFKMDDATDPLSGSKTVGMHYLKEEFEKLYPEATVEFILMGWDAYQQKTQAMLQAGEADVYQVPGIASLAAQGLLEPLAPYIEKDGYDLGIYIDNQVKGWMAMGPEDSELTIYSLPFIGDTRFIAYDKQLFDEWGVEYLSEYPTIEEIKEKAAKMTGKNPVSGEENYGFFFRGRDAADSVVNITEGLGGIWGTGFRWEDMQTEFDSPEMVEAMTWLVSMLEYSPKGVITGQGGEQWLTPANNIAINFRQGPGLLKAMEAAGLNDRIGIAKLFVHPEYKMGGMFAGSPFAIGANSENKDLAWAWLKFSASETFQKYFWDTYYSSPTIKAAFDWPNINAVPQAKPVLESMGMLWAPRYPYRSGQPRSILSTNVEKALLGEVTPAEAMAAAQAETQQWLKDQMK
jgi:ABC-type glycerol-3-phosphate transport system substrate-binding protein